MDKIADFITFIHKGEIVFSKSKEELMDDYCVIKGKKEQKPMIENESIVGVRETDFGFEAMTNKKADFIKKFGDAFIYETPNIEEIMLFSVKGGKEIVSTY